jgi:DNA-binding transcriptional regulator YiaG
MSHQLYRHFDDAGTLLYVGIGLCSIGRLSQHRRSAHWFRRITRVEIQHFADEQSAMAAEAAAIRDERPLFNKRGLAEPKKSRTPQPALRRYLSEREITQESFARQLNVTQTLISQWLNGSIAITAERAEQLERATGIPRLALLYPNEHAA